MCAGHAAQLCFFPGGVRRYPCDASEFVLLCEDARPKIAVLDTGDGSSLENACESVGDIATVSHEVQAALGALQGDEYSENFTPMGGLVLPQDGAV